MLEGEILEKESDAAREQPWMSPRTLPNDIQAVITKALRAAGLMKTP